MRTYEAHKAFYDKLQMDVAKAEAGGDDKAEPDEVLATLTVSTRLTKIAKRFKARAILISGCQDNQSSYDGAHNGAFTGRLLTVWNRGNFDGNYATFHAHIKSRHAGDPDAEPVHDGAGGHLPEAEALHRLRCSCAPPHAASDRFPRAGATGPAAVRLARLS